MHQCGAPGRVQPGGYTPPPRPPDRSPMNVLFEEDGAFRAGTVLADQNTSLQVELPSGRRAKVKATSVLLRFAEPSAADLLAGAERAAEALDTEFLWEVSTDEEFAFEDLAREYHGRAPGPVEAAAILLRLHAAPIWFHRKGRGRFRKAPPDILKAALAGLEKKRHQAEAIERMAAELAGFTLPAELQPLLRELMYKPDRNRPETKAFEQACATTGLSGAHLLARCGALPASHDYHLGRFLFEQFPEGTDFPPHATPAAAADHDLPLAPVQAFSIDDAHTTEIDDAFSYTPRADGGFRLGIHIAAPALGFAPGSPLDGVARRRLSTVYMPGRKITMLPETVVEDYTLLAGRTCPALSLYLDIDAALRVSARETRIERVPVTANLRHHDIEPVFNEDTLAAGGPDFPYKAELTRLWEFATVCEGVRGKPAANQWSMDFTFVVDWSEPGGRVAITERRRGSPLDKLVAELMIVANSTWGKQLAQAKVAAIYRAQSAGKVRMTTSALPHEGLGVECYAWSSSPLRRYVDLLNQWQLVALLQGHAAPFSPRSEALLAAMRDFDLTYAAYAEFQRHMERYWCLRWIEQEGLRSVVVRVVRENLVRIEGLPLTFRLPSLPPQAAAGQRAEVAIETIDLLEVELRARFVGWLAGAAAPGGAGEDDVAGD